MDNAEGIVDGRSDNCVEKLSSISWLRIAATVAVVILHSCTALTSHEDIFPMTGRERIFLIICSELMVWAVPCFFMITGSLLLDGKRKLTVKDCVYKYAKRMAVVLFVFGIPMSMMIILFDTRSFEIRTIGQAIQMVVSGSSMDHLWYLYAIIGIYLSLPLFRVFTDHCNRETLQYLLAALFVFEFCVPFCEQLFKIKINFSLPLGAFLFYVLLGAYLKDFCPRRTEKWVWTAILTCLAACIVISEIFLDGRLSDFAEGIFSYSSPFTVIYAMSIYRLFGEIHSKPVRKSLWKIDRLCFGVYLIHPVLIQTAYRYFHITPVSVKCYPAALVLFAVLFVAVSFLGSWVLCQIGFLRKYIL